MLYFYLTYFSLQRFLVYPFELIASVSKRLLSIVFYVFLWSMVLKQTSPDFELNRLLAYFLIATGVSDITMSNWGELARYLKRSIKNGHLNYLLIKPLNIIPSAYFISIGQSGTRIFMSIVFILVGITMLPLLSFFQILIFLCTVMVGIAVGIAYNVMVATIYFFIGDASGIDNSINHIVRLFTGLMIPLYLFPQHIQEIIRYLPFPFMSYVPASVLTDFDHFDLGFVLVGIIWAGTLLILSLAFWKYAIKHYEAIGI